MSSRELLTTDLMSAPPPSTGTPQTEATLPRPGTAPEPRTKDEVARGRDVDAREASGAGGRPGTVSRPATPGNASALEGLSAAHPEASGVRWGRGQDGGPSGSPAVTVG